MVVHTQVYAKFWKKTVEALEEPMYNPSLPMYAHMNEVMSKVALLLPWQETWEMKFWEDTLLIL